MESVAENKPKEMSSLLKKWLLMLRDKCDIDRYKAYIDSVIEQGEEPSDRQKQVIKFIYSKTFN